jgi:hypothetical protein
MFTPSREEARQFFYDAWARYRSGTPLVGLEAVALDVILAHPEYREALQNAGEAQRDYTVESGSANPFLHLSLHLAIEEQLSIDQPQGLRSEFERIARKLGDRHAALHAVLECLGQTIWRSQRDSAPPDAEAYLECVRRK